jgi:hypothetical protein
MDTGATAARRTAVPLLVVTALCLLLAAWVGSNPPGYGPDEQVHQVKAIGAGTGQWRGQPGQQTQLDFGHYAGEQTRVAWIKATTRAFALPAGLNPYLSGYPCDVLATQKALSCLNVPQTPAPATTAAPSYVGTYEPYLYALPGVVMAHLSEARDSLYAGRVVNALLAAVLLGLACLAAWDRKLGLLSLTGVLLAATPTTLFLGSALGTNGIEIAASLCLLTLALRSARPGGAPSWAWPAAAFAGLLLATARSTGPAWVVAAAALAVVQIGPRRAWRSVADRPRRSLPALAVILLGLAATGAWELLYQAHPAFHLSYAESGFSHLQADAPYWAHQWVGVFGWSNVYLPSWADGVWLAAVAALVLAALAVASWAQRLLVAAVLITSAVLVVALDVLVFQQTQFPVFGRYTLAVVVAVPLVAAEVLVRREARVPLRVRRAAPLGFVLLVAPVHLVGLWASARRAAVGTAGPVNFIGRSEWVPPGGWSPWGLLGLAAAAALVLAGVLALTERSQQRVPAGQLRP